MAVWVASCHRLQCAAFAGNVGRRVERERASERASSPPAEAVSPPADGGRPGCTWQSLRDGTRQSIVRPLGLLPLRSRWSRERVRGWAFAVVLPPCRGKARSECSAWGCPRGYPADAMRAGRAGRSRLQASLGGESEDGNVVRRGATVPPGESQGALLGERASGCWRRDAAAAVTRYGRRVPSAEKRCSYLVDPASSHMLVSKTKPCTCKYERSSLRNCEWLIKSVTVHLTVPPLG